MCDPVTATLFFTAPIWGPVVEGRQQQQMMNAQADVANLNARMVGVQMGQEAKRNELEKTDLLRRAGLQKAQGRTGYAAGNVLLDAGSPVDWEVSHDTMVAEDIGRLDYQTAMNLWGLQTQQTNYRAQANLYEAAGKNAWTSSLLSIPGNTMQMGSMLIPLL